ncbi:MAG: universal stress protein [Dehalococcoidales bacterium]|jgi:nucleotide-binding universal stress UspA family protein
MYHRILIPLDGSKLAEQVFPAVLELAGPLNSEIIIMGACEANAKEEGETCALYLKDASRVLDSRLAGSTATLKTEVLYGKPSEEILRYAQDEKIDIIFMTSHGRSGIMPWSLGSTVDKVFKRTSVPLVVVKAREKVDKNSPSVYSRILITLDGSDKSIAVLPYIRELAKIVDCEVFPIRVVEAGRHVRTIGGLDYIRYVERDMSSTKDAVIKSLEEVCSDLAQTKAKVHCEVKTGEPAKEILGYADDIDCTLIAMTSHGHHGMETWALGSVASKVVAVAKQSVLLVPSFIRKPE